MRAILTVLVLAVFLASAAGAYLAYERYRGLERDLAACTNLQGTARAELGIRSAEFDKLQREHAQQKAELANLDSLKSQSELLSKQVAAFQSLTVKLQKMIDTGKLRVMVRKGRMVLKLPAEVLFSSGRAELSTQGRGALGEVANVLKEFPDRSFMVAGHTDAEPVKDSGYRNNWQLSTARALTVSEFFIEQGVKPQNLVTAGYGEFDPISSNDNARGRQENRRIELVLLPNVEEIPRLLEETKQVTANTAGMAAQPAP